MDEGRSDADGKFQLSGHVDEFTTIDPKLNIYHDCDDGLMVIYLKSLWLFKLKHLTLAKFSTFQLFALNRFLIPNIYWQ